MNSPHANPRPKPDLKALGSNIVYVKPVAVPHLPQELREQAGDVRALAARLVSQAEAVPWHGKAAEAMRERIRERAGHLRVAAAQHDTAAESLAAHVAEVDGRVVGMAVWYLTFSTWTGVNGIWLEDLFVEPEQRGAGLGRELLATLARTCVDRGYQRLEWWVLDWNEPSIGFYRSLGAVPQDEWTVFRMDGAALASLGT